MAPKQLFTVDGHLDLATNAMTLNRDLTKDVKEIRNFETYRAVIFKKVGFQNYEPFLKHLLRHIRSDFEPRVIFSS